MICLFFFLVLNSWSTAQIFFPGQKPSSLPACGRRITVPEPARFVVGGRDAQVGQFPWSVLTLRSDNTSCGGILLSEKFVLSAAHCHEDGVTITAVRVGATKITGGEQDTYRVRQPNRELVVGSPQVIKVANAIVHPEYKRDKYGVTYSDLVLLELESPIAFGPLIQPVCLPSDDSKDFGVSTVMGWGRALKNDFSSTPVSAQNHLKYADLDILKDQECEEAYKTINSGIKLDPKIHICAGKEVGVDSCSGDSGGPLVVRKGFGRRARSYLVGVVSGGPACAQGYAGYYVRVSHYFQWINKYL